MWITPFYTSPQNDHGYDVADYRDVDPLFGTLADFDAMLAKAHDLGLRVIVDLVPNHTSERARVVPRGAGRRAGLPRPGPLRLPRRRRARRRRAAEQLAVDLRRPRVDPRRRDGQWYLHMFDPTQPDLNWWNPEVGDEFESVLRFWLDRGVDGFRIDVAHGLYNARSTCPTSTRGQWMPMWDQPEVHEVYRRWRKILDEYDGERMAVAEAWTDTPESMARYVRADELHQTFNFHWLEAPWRPAAFRRVITESLDAVGLVGASATWVLSNHDVVRHVTRYGGGAQGLARGRAALLAMLALPGGSYIYQGEELGLEQVEVPHEHKQDPSCHRGGDESAATAAGCRCRGRAPRRRSGSAPARASRGCRSRRPGRTLTVEAQEQAPDSTLSFYRTALRGPAPADRRGRRRGHLAHHRPRDAGLPPRRRLRLHGQLRVARGPGPGRGRRAGALQRPDAARRAPCRRTPRPGSSRPEPQPPSAAL